MPRTVDEGFRDFLTTLTPSSYESDAAKRHRASLQACLGNNYTLYRFARIGSFGNGTSISGYSDVDYIAEVSVSDLSDDSSYCLGKLRSTLDYRFPYTGVVVRCPTVHVPFGTDARDATEVVLAKDTYRTTGGHSIYRIADCAGGWKDAAPDAHKAYVLAQDERLSNRVRPLIRFIKAWKFYQSVPISSFYLEMRVAQYAATQQSIVYDMDVKSFLSWLVDKKLASLQDPVGVSGYIAPCKTQPQLEDAWSKLNTASTRADKARAAESSGSTKDAFYWWDLLYNYMFPSYYY